MKWISVKDKLPPTDQDVLVIRNIDGKFYIPDVVIYNDGNYIGTDERADYLESSKYVTHWMPLPEPPKIND